MGYNVVVKRHSTNLHVSRVAANVEYKETC